MYFVQFILKVINQLIFMSKRNKFKTENAFMIERHCGT